MDIQQAITAINSGGIVAYPTEAVWGLGCNPWDIDAVKRLLKIKQRSHSKGFVIVASSIDQISKLCTELPQSKLQQLQQTWPGPYNWIIPDKQSWFPNIVRGGHSGIAIRVSDHPLIKKLCNAAGHPLISTSANISGQLPCLTAQQVDTVFADKISGFINGDLGDSTQPCLIRDLTTGKIIRNS
jgi:L-threonylcarbamoyladenylate synthase